MKTSFSSSGTLSKVLPCAAGQVDAGEPAAGAGALPDGPRAGPHARRRARPAPVSRASYTPGGHRGLAGPRSPGGRGAWVRSRKKETIYIPLDQPSIIILFIFVFKGSRGKNVLRQDMHLSSNDSIEAPAFLSANLWQLLFCPEQQRRKKC